MKKTAYLGLFTALAIIFGYIESLFPVFFGFPGIKLGIANIVIILMLYVYTWKEAAFVSVIRVLSIGFLFGNLYSILFSLAGAGFSLFLMVLMKHFGFHRITVSIVGGVSHNIAQIAIAAFVVGSYQLYYMLPIMLLSGTVAGVLIGIAANLLIRHLGPVIRRIKQEEL